MIRKIRSYLLFWPALVMSTLFIFVPLLINKLTFRSSKFTSRVNRFWGKTVFWASGSTITIKGEIKGDGPFVIVANHTSMLDIAVALVVLGNVDFRFASRPLFFKIPILRQDMLWGGHFPLDRDNPRKSLRELYALEGFKRGESLMMFPEGTRSLDGEIKDFDGGAAATAIHHGVPVLPMRFSGLYDAFPKGKHFPRPTAISVRIGEPILTDGLNSMKDAGRLTEKVQSWVSNAVEVPR